MRITDDLDGFGMSAALLNGAVSLGMAARNNPLDYQVRRGHLISLDAIFLAASETIDTIC